MPQSAATPTSALERLPAITTASQSTPPQLATASHRQRHSPSRTRACSDGAYVAAGSVITDNVPAEALGIARGRPVQQARLGRRPPQGIAARRKSKPKSRPSDPPRRASKSRSRSNPPGHKTPLAKFATRRNPAPTVRARRPQSAMNLSPVLSGWLASRPFRSFRTCAGRRITVVVPFHDIYLLSESPL